MAVPANNLKIPFASPHKTANFVARPELGESKKGERTGPLTRINRLEKDWSETGKVRSDRFA